MCKNCAHAYHLKQPLIVGFGANAAHYRDHEAQTPQDDDEGGQLQELYADVVLGPPQVFRVNHPQGNEGDAQQLKNLLRGKHTKDFEALTQKIKLKMSTAIRSAFSFKTSFMVGKGTDRDHDVLMLIEAVCFVVPLGHGRCCTHLM